jgi:hypothetical protein
MKSTWYYNINLKPQGPFNLEEMRAKIHRGEIGLQELVYNENSGNWAAASAWPEFEMSLFPAKQAELRAGDLDMHSKEWVLLQKNQAGEFLQQGPFCILDLQKMISYGEIQTHQYIWKSGLSGWVKIADHEVLGEALTL